MPQDVRDKFCDFIARLRTNFLPFRGFVAVFQKGDGTIDDRREYGSFACRLRMKSRIQHLYAIWNTQASINLVEEFFMVELYCGPISNPFVAFFRNVSDVGGLDIANIIFDPCPSDKIRERKYRLWIE